MISFACPRCQRRLKVRDEAAGKTAPCPGCEQPVQVPVRAPTETVAPCSPGPTPVNADDTVALRPQPAADSASSAVLTPVHLPARASMGDTQPDGTAWPAGLSALEARSNT